MQLAAAAILLGQNAPAMARNFTVNDLLSSENFGTVTFGPRGRWLVFEQLAPFEDMVRFDMLARAHLLRSRLYRVDLDAPWRAVPLLADAEPGMVVYGFSPDGSRLAIGRLAGGRWRLGVVTMATGAVRWFDVSPDYTPFYETLHWVSDVQLVAIVEPDGQRPWWLRADSLPADRLPARWAATRSGSSPAATVIGSGRFLAVNDRPPDKRLVLIDAATGASTNLASGPYLSMTVSADRTHLALVEQGAATPPPANRPVSQRDWPFRQTVAIYDLQNRKLWHPCPACDLLGSVTWSPDGRRLVFFARQGGDDWSKAALFSANVSDTTLSRVDAHGIVPTISEGLDGSAHAAFAWHGSNLLLFGHAAADAHARSDWYLLSGPGREALTAALPHVSAELGATTRCAAAMTAGDGTWCLDGRTPRRLFGPTVQVADGRAVGWRVAKGTVIIEGDVMPGRALQIGASDRIERIDVSPPARVIVVHSVSERGVRTLTLVRRHLAVPIAQVNLPLRDVEPATARPLGYRLSDGQEVTSWLYLPPNAPNDHRLPLVVIPYPGQVFGHDAPLAAGPAGETFDTNEQLLADHGYAVLLPSLPAETGLLGQPPRFVADVARAVDAAVATGRVDPHRVALWGHSYGAYATAVIAAHSCRYATAIASNGVYDLAADIGTFGPNTRLAPEQSVPIGTQFAWAETGQAHLGVPPWVDPARYVAASPVYQADHIKIPMLITGADRDFAPIQQAEELFSDLFRQDKDAELVTYWGEGHVIGSPGNVHDLYGRVFTWLDKTMARPQPDRCAPSALPPPAPASRAPNAP